MGANGEFSRNLQLLLAAGFNKCATKIEDFRVLLDDKALSLVTLESLHAVTGQIIGCFEALLQILYKEK